MTSPTPLLPRATGGPDQDWIPRRGAILALAVLTLVGLALRLYNLTDKSLGFNSAFSLWLIRQPFDDFWRCLIQLEQQPPLYFVLLRGWAQLSGEEAGLRVFSVLWGTATIPIMYGIGQLIGARVLGLIAAAFFAVSPLNIDVAQQVRMQTMATFLTALSVLCLLQILIRGGRSQPETGPSAPWWRAVRDPWWWGFVVATAGAALTQRTGILLPVTIGLFLVLAAFVPAMAERELRGTPQWRQRLRVTALGLGAALALWLTWLPNFIAQSTQVDDRLYWADRNPVAPYLTAEALLRYWQDIAGAYGPEGMWALGPVIVLLLLAGVGCWALRGRPAVAILMVLLTLTPLLTFHLVQLRQTNSVANQLVWTTPAIVVLLAAGVLALRLRPVVVAVLAAVLVLFGSSVVTYYGQPDPDDWRGVAGEVSANAQPGDIILFVASRTQLPFDNYFRGSVAAEHGVPVTLFDRGIVDTVVEADDLPRIDRLIAGRSRVWLIYSQVAESDPGRIVPARLRELLELADQRRFGSIQLWLFTAPPVPGPGR